MAQVSALSKYDKATRKLLRKLTEGNREFVKDPQYIEERKHTEDAQHPCVTVISCSDSRVSIPLIFNMPHIGKFFQICTAGQALASSDLESIRYAIENLEASVKIVIVLGHTHCGAVKATVESLANTEEGHAIREAYPTIVRNIKPSVDRVLETIGEEDQRKVSVKDFIEKVEAQNAIDKAKEIEFLLDGKSPVIPALYNISTGKIKWL